MDLSWRYDFWLRGLPSSPKDSGSVVAVVRRPPGEHGVRERLDVGRFSVAEGLEGDRWLTDPEAQPTNQVTLINVHVLRSLCKGDEAKMALSGDNLQVDLDLTETNLPVGTRLQIGELLLEITPEVHRPCSSFVERFGATAAKKVARATRISKRGRGAMCCVIEPGEVRPGDRIEVQRVSETKAAGE